MKQSSILILFILITIPFFIVFNIKNNFYSTVLYERTLLNNKLSKATNDAIAIASNNNDFELNKDKVEEVFYKSFFVNLGVHYDEERKEYFNSYIPAIVIVDYDGVYIKAHIETNESDIYKTTWSEKSLFTSNEDDYIINFTLSEDIEVIDIANNTKYTGHYSEFKDVLSFCNSYNDFTRIKLQTIQNVIMRETNKHINTFSYADKNYKFVLPDIEDTDWYNIIDNASVIVFVQNLPLVGDVVYSNYAVGTSSIYNDKQYYLEVTEEGTNVIHKRGCSSINLEEFEPLKSVERAIENGATVHEECIGL